MDFSNIFLISDLDGTLIDRDFTVPRRNIEAIARFQRAGGHFSIATGRSFASGRQYIQAVSPNSPGILLNGTVLYDFEENRILLNRPLDLQIAKSFIEMIRDRFPTAGLEVFATEKQNVVCFNHYIKAHIEREEIPCCDQNVFDGRPLCKVLIADDPDVIQQMIAFTKTIQQDKVRFVTSSEYYLEMLPVGVDKGSALKDLVQLCGFSIEQVYAIGDYYNDVELLQAAGFAAMPCNAPEDLKKNADLVVCSCSDGAIADLIEYIERKVK